MTPADRVIDLDAAAGAVTRRGRRQPRRALAAAAAAARLVRAGHARAPATSPSAARSPPTSTARTTTATAASARTSSGMTLALADGSVAGADATAGRDPELFWATRRRHGADRRRPRRDAAGASRSSHVVDVASTPSGAGDLDAAAGGAGGRDDRLPLLGGLDRLLAARRPPRPRRAHRGRPRAPADAAGAAAAARRRRSADARPGSACRRWSPPGLLNRASVARLQRGLVPQGAPRGATASCRRSARSSTRSTGCATGTGSTARAGFVQYQFVVPDDARAVRERCCAGVRVARAPSFLAVLKRFGAGNPGPLSFPRAGLDARPRPPGRRPRLGALLDDLDDGRRRGGRQRLPGQGLPAAPELLPAHVPAARRVARGPRTGRPAPASSRPTWPGRLVAVMDALGAPQSLAVLGGTSEIALAVGRAARAAAGCERVVLAGRDAAALGDRGRPARDGRRVTTSARIAFEATDTADHAALVARRCSPDGDVDVVLRRLRGARRPGGR